VMTDRPWQASLCSRSARTARSYTFSFMVKLPAWKEEVGDGSPRRRRARRLRVGSQRFLPLLRRQQHVRGVRLRCAGHS
jgi:hypothetical protein